MRIFLFTLTILTNFIFISSANAQETSESCGVPSAVDINTDALPHCDIYHRQFAYREEALKLEKKMKERQENFAAPRREALKRYEEDMKKLNTERGSDQ